MVGDPVVEARPEYVLRALELFAGYGDRDAIVGIQWEGRWTYAQARALILEMAARLRDAGYRPGMTVGIVVAHPPEAPFLQLALHLLGCRTAWIESDSPRRDIDEYLALVPPERFIYDTRTRHAKVGRQLADALGVPVHCLGPDGHGPDLLVPATSPVEPFDLSTAAGAVESIYQTTGTTGRPKLLRHGARMFDQMTALGENWEASGRPHLRHLSLTPMWHAAGQAVALLNLTSGGTLFIPFRFRSWEYLEAIEEHRATSGYISPLMLNAILDDPLVETADLSSMRLLSLGGGAVTPARLRQAIERFGPVVRMTYGLSELPYISDYPNMTEDPDHPDRLRSCGRPYGDVRVEIRDEDGNVLPPGEVGELWASSKLCLLEYVGQPKLTAERLVDGWLRTRDLGYADEDGYLHLVGRSQDLIITGVGGEHIYPRPIEEVISAHPDVRAVTVIGVPDDELGEVAYAYVVTAEGASVSAEELSGPITETLGQAWVPQTFEFVAELPQTNNGKVDVKALKAAWAATHATTAPDTIGAPT
jgi:acyl-CoA synthetase (AMP-forming)/AMP-acid ligase II